MTSLNATTPTSRPLAEAKPEASPVFGGLEWLTRMSGEWEWRLHPAWSFLVEAGGPDWTRLEDNPRATQIKSNDGRQVWRVELDRGLVFAKVARPPRQWPRLRRWYSGSDATKECRIAEYAAKHGIATIRPVARAEAPISNRRPVSILITEGLPRSRSLAEVWSGLDVGHRSTRRIKNHIIDEVARLLAHAHQNGFEHYDLHSGNLLLDALPLGRFRPVFVDLHSVRVGRPVSDRGVIRNLAQFNQWFRIHATLTDRIRFMGRYMHWRSALMADSTYGRRLGCGPKELLARLEGAAIRHANALYAKRDKRVLRSGRYFERLSLPGGWHAHVFLEAKHAVPGSRASQMAFNAEQWRSWLADPLALLKPASRRDLLKDSATTKVCRAQLAHPEGPIDVICKRTVSKNTWKPLQTLVRCSRPMSTWHRANALLHRQILTARPLAVLERRRMGMVVDSVLITESIEHAIDLDTLLTVTLRDLPEKRQKWLKSRVTDSLARVIRNLLERGYRHRDLKAPNVIVQWNPAGQEDPRIVLVDLDGVLPLRRRGDEAKRRMLMRLNVSLDHCRRVTQTDRLRFLQRVMSRYGVPLIDWKPLWRNLCLRSARKRFIRERHQQRKFKKYGRF